MNQRKAGVALSYVRLFLSSAISLLFLPFMLRMLGQSEYGLYQVVGSLSAYLSILDMGLSSTVTRYVARYRTHDDDKGQENFVSLIFIIYVILAVGVILIGLVLYRYLPALFDASLTAGELSRARTMFLLLIANAAITILTNGFRGICVAYEQFVFLRVQDIAQILIRVVILVILLSNGYGAVSIVVTDLVLNAIFSVIRIAYTFLKLHVSFRFHALDWSLLGEVGAFAFFVFLTAVGDQLFWKTGGLVLGVLTSTSVVAVYSIGNQISTIYASFSMAISSVMLPSAVVAVERNASGSELTGLMTRTGRVQLLVLGLILTGFASFGQSFILLWVGPGYEKAYWVALVVLLPWTVDLVQNVGISILQAKNKHPFRSFVLLAMGALNVLITVVLVRSMGMVGAAYGTAISLTLGNVVVINIYYQRVIGLQIGRFFRELAQGLVPVLMLALLVGLGLNRLLPGASWGAFLVKVAAFTVFYVAAMWLLGMNDYEKRLFRGLAQFGRKHAAGSRAK